MALPKVSPGLLPAENYNRFNQAFGAIDDLAVQLRQEINDRANAIQQQAQARADGDNNQAANLSATDKAVTAQIAQIYVRISAEETARAIAIQEQAVARANGDTDQARNLSASDAAATAAIKVQADRITAESLNRGNAIAVAVAGLRDMLAAKVDAEDLQAQVEALAAIADAFAQLQVLVAARRLDFVPNTSRPGDNPLAFTQLTSPYAMGGVESGLPLVPPDMATFGDAGSVLRIVGGAAIGMRRAAAVEPNRAYRVRAAFQRRADPSDPAGDAIVFGIAFLDQSRNPIAGTSGAITLLQIPSLRVQDGRQEAQATVARTAGVGADIVAPPRARYARAFLRTFGPDGVTDLEILDIEDVSSATLLDPISSDVAARVSAIESQDLSARTSVLERKAGTPSSVTYASKADAQAAAIPESAVVAMLLGVNAPGDGRSGLYRRATNPPAGADTFVSGGTVWQRVDLADDVVTAAVAAWFARLPSTIPSRVGAPWNNGNTLAFA